MAMATLHAEEVSVNKTAQTRSTLIEQTFNGLNSETMHILPSFYHEDVVFQDPLVEIEGLDILQRHYEHLYKSVESIEFIFKEEYIAGDVHTLEWDMTMQQDSLNRGKAFTIEGVSIIEFNEDDLVIRHSDYFDVGAMVYERVPVVRALVKFVKNKLNAGIEE